MEQAATVPRWVHFSHEADIGVRGIGRTKSEAFEQAALALTEVITETARVIAHEKVNIVCQAPDDELLLVDWLNAVIYEMATRHMLFSRFRVGITDHHLQGSAFGETIDLPRHRPAVEVKGATYTSLSVRQDPAGHWEAQCVVDV